MASQEGEVNSQQQASSDDDEYNMEEEATGTTAAEDTAGGKKKIKFPCIRCQENVVKNGVQCTSCHLWVHIPCQKISKDLYKILKDPKKFPGYGTVTHARSARPGWMPVSELWKGTWQVSGQNCPCGEQCDGQH